MKILRTRAVLSDIEADTVLRELLQHLDEHELVARNHEGGWLLDYDGAQIWFLAGGDTLRAEVSAPHPELLYDARTMAHHHMAEFAACEPERIQWEGDRPEFERPPAFRVLTTIAVEEITPHMRRVRFSGVNLDRYVSDEDIHCKLLFPSPRNLDPEWPTLGADGMPRFPAGDKRLDVRTYTIRRIDAVAGWMDVDFVLHENAGPGSGWAARATPGMQIGLSGPGGRTARPAAWMLLAADDTGLAAIARIAETLPPETRGEVILEVQSAEDEQALSLPEGMRLQWLHRGDRPAGTTAQLRETVMAVSIPPEGDRFAWVAAEFSMAQAVRSWLRDEVGLRGREQLVVAYWRLGMDETRMKGGGTSSQRNGQSKKVAE